MGIVYLFCGTVITSASWWTFLKIRRRKSLKYLRMMTLLILAIGLIHVIWGSVIIGVNFCQNLSNSIEFILTEIGRSLENISTFIIVWLISFKYWETITQLIFYLGNEAGATKEILRMRHEKYSFRKKMGIAIVCITVMLRALFQYLSIQYIQSNEGNHHNLIYLAILTLLDIVVATGYVICLWLVTKAVNVLRRFLKEETVEGIDTRAACLHISVILLMLLG